MLQPRRSFFSLLVVLAVFVDSLRGQDYINTSPRRRRQDEKDVTTVLLVGNHGRPSFGRFLSVKPDLGLITSTARTFIQEGVTTEYATQVLGTTLDNGRLYAHLLTKSSRVLYDDAPSKVHELLNKKKWNVNDNVINAKQFIKNTDYISPSRADAVYVFPTEGPAPFYTPIDNNSQEDLSRNPQQIIEDEILKESPTNNFRALYEENLKKQNNVKVFKISPQMKDLTHENIINHKEIKEDPLQDGFAPSKVRPWDNLPTFTVRNEFSPSGLSFLGDFPDFDARTERSKPTTPAERKAKLLFRAGLAKPNPRDFTSITYTGFADFTTTVGDTVIVFTPHTTTTEKLAEVTSISVEPTLIQPTTTLLQPPVVTEVKTFLSQEPPMETQTIEGHKLDMKTLLPTMVIDKTDRSREPKSELPEEHFDMDAMSAVLAHEQGQETVITSSSETTFTPEVIQPSETQPSMLSTPSDEDIAKIFASLQAQAAKQATEPLNKPATIFFDDVKEETTTKEADLGGATTIFFEDEAPIETSSVEVTTASQIVEEHIATTEEEQTTTEEMTTEKLPETTENPTTQKQETTTNEILTTSEDIISTIPVQQTTPEITPNEEETEAPEKEDNENSQPKMMSVPSPEDIAKILASLQAKANAEAACTDSKIVPTTAYKTLTYLTTFFIDDEDAEGGTSTSIKSNEVVSSEVGYQTLPCDADISPTSVVEPLEQTDSPKVTTGQPTEEETDVEDGTEEIVQEQPDTEDLTTHEVTTYKLSETTPQEITTERRHVTESEIETTEATTEDGDEVELIYKTLYTTYTYLTTYFQDSTSSIASRIVVTTNVITSTLDPGSEATDPAVAGLLERDENLSSPSKTVSFDDIADITPSSVAVDQASAAYDPERENGDENDADESQLMKPTPILDDDKVLQTGNGVKTYYTTYTYFTTIFVDGETEISSRTEVYTNYVTPSVQASAVDSEISPTQLVKNQLEVPLDDDDDDGEDEIRKKILSLNSAPQEGYNTISRHKTVTPGENENDIYDDIVAATPSLKEQGYVTLQRSGTTTEDNEIDNNILNLSEYETISTMVTDVRSSTSEGDRRILENVDKRNVLLDDQIVSESNNDSEIIPSPTLLLQTSYTTFTYFTTMYHGTTSSNVVSRLETITNVVTKTLTPTQTLSVEDLSLPVTYFTTFTYWTTLYKDNTTKVTSREETVSNIVTPSIEATSISPIVTTPIPEEIAPTESTETIVPSTVGDDDLTTYFTTYTYFTTSYIGNSTVLNSRLETVTNVVNNSDTDSNEITTTESSADAKEIQEVEQPKIEPTSLATSLKPTGLLSTTLNTEVNDGTTTIHSTDVYGTYIEGVYANVLESTSTILTETIAPSSVPKNLKPTGIVSINKGKIVDAEGVSTLFYTTQAVGTYIDDSYAQVIESTSSLSVDEEKKAALPSTLPIAQRTGLVRVVEGSIIQNDTTTFYVSKVLGTNIDGKYAQIIESTSSFLVGSQASVKPSTVANEVAPSPTQAPDQKIAATDTISPSPVVIESSISDSAKNEDETSTEENEEEGDDDKDNSRVKSRLTFQSRKRTFTPAIRPFASRQRPTFAPKRKQSGQSTAATITRSDFTPTVTAVPASKPNRFGGRRSSSAAIQPTASGRRFARPKSTSAGGNRKGSSSRIQPTATGFGGSSRRGGGFRSSTPGGAARSSSLFGARPRIRPTLASGLNRSPSSQVTQASIEDDNDLTTFVTDNPTDSIGEDAETTLALQTTTEGSSRRSQNPLLRFRRPPLPRPTQSSRTTAGRSGKSGNLNNKKATSTTPKPKVSYNRPSSLLNRPRPNALFPRRGLFTTTTTPPPEEEEEEEGEDVEDLEEEGDTEEDTDYDSSLTNTQIASPPDTLGSTRTGRSSNVQIKPFFRRRSKRDTYSRFRRPTGRTTTAAPAASQEEPESEAPPPKQSGRGRFSPKNRGKAQTTTSAPTTRKRITPSKASTQSRSQFTLREKDTASTRTNFKRPKSSTRTTRPTAASRPKAPRLRNNHQTEAPARKANSNSRQSSRTTGGRSRTTPKNNHRARYQKENTHHQQQPELENFVVPEFDGTITITHQVATEVTIPVVNGKITEYKNVVSAIQSTEVLDPRQYSTSINALGKEIKVLLSENTAVDNNGATFITQFVLNETPTTTVIFTPTYINRRKTSFSHVIPSTVYDVEQVVNTIQPALAAQAPLANILLSQLLLGGLQPQANPLLALQQPALAQPTPTTEYKTRTTTYVTTVTSETSTVIPLTFRGKEILTTIVDSSVSVITATEFLTDTVVVTPTLGFPLAPQLNTALLLPLLQQQLQQQQQQASNPLLPQPLAEPLPPQALYQEPDKFNLAIDDSSELQSADEATPAPRRKTSRKNRKNKPTPATPPKETSIVTLYVSGRTPGEFTTVLSTVTVGEENNRKKRDIPYVPVQPSVKVNDMKTRTNDNFDSYVMPAMKEVHLESSEIGKETESLESIIGDVTKHLTTQTPELFNIKPTKSSKASKKYKINVSDLSKVAPLMPKVETSLNPRGQLSFSQSDNNNNENNVSNYIGNGEDVTSNLVNTNDKTRFKRYKRNLDDSYDEDEDEDVVTKPPVRKKRRRVVKKLIRVQPINNNINTDTSTESTEIDVTTKRARRRLLIKKKKKKRLLHRVNNDNIESEDNLQQGTKPRRKIVITKKRLLPNRNKTLLLSATELPISTTTLILDTATIQSHQSKFTDNDQVDTTEENLIDDETDDDNVDVTKRTPGDDEEDKEEKKSVKQDNGDINLIEDDRKVTSNIERPQRNNEDIDDDDDESSTAENLIEDDSSEDDADNTDDDDEDDDNAESDEDDDNTESNEDADNAESNEDDTDSDEEDTDDNEEDEDSNEEDNEVTTENNDNEKDTDNTEKNTVSSVDEDDEEVNDKPTFQSIPEYEPFFPELTESIDAPVLLLKTTILSNVELMTKTVTQSRLRTYTFVVTRVNDNEQIVTSTTEVKPQVKTSVIVESHTRLTTLTLLDFDPTTTMTEPQHTLIPTSDNPQPQLLNQDNAGRGFEEARYNLATRVMSNGVEVIVAGDKSTLPGEPDIKRLLSSTSYKPVTLKPSTLSDQMVMMLPQDSSNIQSLTSSLYPNQFVTKTCLTTFTYLTTYLEGGTTTVSSHEQVVSNIATEERNTGKILPTPTVGITLTQYPNLSVGVFHTTYTYLNTILDGEQPLVVSSKHTVTNTVTAPDDYLSFLKSSDTVSAIKDTNTYYSTIPLEKTLYEGDKSSIVSTNEVVTQVVITESVPPRATSVMTSYIALDMDSSSSSMVPYTTTDVVKTYFVTYTYYNTIMENGTPIVNTNVSTSSDVVTEKLYLYPKKTSSSVVNTSPIVTDDKKKQKIDLSGENFHILATKTYFTTFTYFTTLLQEENLQKPTVISSRTSVIQNIVTETVDPNLLDKKYLNIIKNEIKDGSNSITKVATLQDGQKLEITAVANEVKEKIKPTKVLPIEKTKDPETTITSEKPIIQSSSSPSVITGSTIIFVDDDPFAQLAPTPTLTSKVKSSTNALKNNLGSLLSSEIVQETKISTSVNKGKRSTKTKVSSQSTVINTTRIKPPGEQSTTKPQTSASSNKGKPQADKKKQTTATKTPKPAAAPAADLLGLGSININSLQALTPVLNAMAGLITTNLKSNRRNDANITTTTTARPNPISKLDKVVPAADTQNRSPIYIPVGGLADDFEIAESQNIATFDWVDPPQQPQIPSKATQEASLLNGGIPISPGDVITANSDVIVGKPGRIGPRIPSIPLNQVSAESNEVPIGMKPPPLPDKVWTNKNVPGAGHIRNDKPLPNIIHAPNKDDYIGPPPPLQNHKEGLRGDKRKQIPLTPPRKEAGRPYYESNVRYDSNEIPPNQHAYPPANNQNYGPIYTVNEVNHDLNIANLQESIQKNYDTHAKNSYPLYGYDQASGSVPQVPINIKPSVINAPIVLPEVIERSTGQPLLVNIQPSQVAFVNIPFNRTTALIYGGSTEPHRNGQYFDDPSPYPEPEFSGIEFNNGVPQVASVYHDEPLNQKQVNGVIKVGNQLINVQPSADEDQADQLNIRPTKPHNDAEMAFGNNHEVSINVPPISFGLIHQGNDFNAHVINHGDIQFRPPATSYEVMVDHENERPTYQKIPQNFHGPPGDGTGDRFTDKKRPAYNSRPSSQHNDISNEPPKRRPEENPLLGPPQGKPKYPTPTKGNLLRPRPNMEISEFMTPPPLNKNTMAKRPYLRRPTSKRPPHIPLTPASHNFNSPYHQHNKVSHHNTIPLRPSSPIDDNKNNIIPIPDDVPVYSIHGDNPSYSNIDLDIGDHRDDDLANEEGEVIQESNSRPLLPGEVPFEILKAKTSTTTERVKNNATIRFPSEEQLKFPNYNNEIIYNERPFVSPNARPFVTSRPSVIKPENKFSRPQIPISRPESHPDKFNKPDGFWNHYSSTETSANKNNGGKNGTSKHKNSPNGFVVVGSQFQEHGNNPFVISGTQFTDVNKNLDKSTSNKLVTTSKPNKDHRPSEATTKNYVVFTENPIDNGFGTKTKNPLFTYRPEPTTPSTQKPIIIYFGDKVENKDEFFHHNTNRNKNKNKNGRPSVTSLPIDTQTAKMDVIHTYRNLSEVNNVVNTQTEKPFVPQQRPSLPSNEVNIVQDVTSQRPTTRRTTTILAPAVTPELNTGEVNVTTELSDMEVMKPPPLITDIPIKQPDTEMQPPKIEVDSHGGDILRVPNIPTEPPIKQHSSSPKPYIPSLLEEMVPPPQTAKDEEVLGMSPPPLDSTHKPIIGDKPPTTTKPVFSMEIDVPKEVPIAFKPSTSTSTERYNRVTRPRRPFTRRPGYHRTTTPSTTSGSTAHSRRPTYPVYVIGRNSSSTVSQVGEKSTTENVITPTPTIKVPSSMEVIIGHPNLNRVQENKPSTTNSPKQEIEISGSEVPIRESTTEKTVVLESKPSVSNDVSISSQGVVSSESKSKKGIITQAVHHAGNEVKIVDETARNSSSKIALATVTKESKSVIPTRYITHTKTSTVTITKTTVIKTLGGPPSTLTILVTKTEKSTIIETVTEVHTLVKPTSITETITTTIHTASSLYPPDVYGSTYPSIQVKPTLVTPLLEVATSTVTTPIFEDDDDDLEDFIISETDPPLTETAEDELTNNDSILVVMTDKNTKNIIKVPNSSETQDRDEVITNKVNDILLGGILSASRPASKVPEVKSDKCEPECKPSKNELCQKVEGVMRCVCRPGFARMFPDRPCLPTYTYDLNITLERIGKDKLHYFDDLANSNSTEFLKFAQAIREALDRMVMQSDLRDIFHGVQVHSFEPSLDAKDIVSRFYLQLSDNIDESRLEDIFKKYLRNNNYSLGGTDIFASPTSLDELRAQDFDECSYSRFHDCSENAQCFNLKGTYTCSCKEGYSDLSENMLYPGRICSADQVGCERCNYHGTCYSREGDEVICECFQWYAGDSCHINLKVLLIALVTLGTILFILLFVCIILTCVRRRPRNAGVASGMSFLPQRVGSSGNRGTLDRRAMIQDTSSEDSRSETNTLPYTQKQKKPKGALKKTSKVSMQHPTDVENGENTLSFSDQKDRSLTVMIPRAKYHPAPPTSPLVNYTTFDARKPSVPSVTEAKLLSYLDAGPSPNKTDVKRKFSKTPSETFIEEKPSSRKTSGALVSAGFEVSATVVNNMGTLGTTCGTEADRSENATLIQKISADLLSSTGTRSQFNTLRKSLVDEDLDNSSNWLDIVPRVTTVSEARSYDETTIPPPMKSFRNDYDSKPSSQHPNDEANTMAERDLGSTFLLPHTHLYKPDRGSDISGFESL